MPAAHRHGDSRTCGATTVVQNQSTVFVNGRLWAVKGDPNTHGGGNLINTGTTVFISGIPVIVHSADPAAPDGLCPIAGGPHCGPATASGSDNVFAY